MVTVLKFSKTWCGPCRALTQTLGKKENLQEVDIEQNMELAQQYKIRNVPTLVFLKNDVEVHRHVGMLSPATYDQILNELNDSKELNETDIMAIEVVNVIFEKGEE